MERIDFKNNQKDIIVSIINFNNSDFWRYIVNKNFYGIFIFENDTPSSILFESVQHEITLNSILFFYPYQKLEFISNLSGKLLLFHPNYFCLDVQAKEYGCQGVIFQNILQTRIMQLSTHDLYKIIHQFSLIEEEIQHSSIGTYFLILNYISILLLLCLRIITSQKKTLLDTDMSRLKILMDEYITSQHQPNFYAQKLNITTRELNFLIKSRTGKTTQKAIHEKLIALAKSKLFNSNLSVKEIAYELGFEDPFYFSRIFKQHTLVSPKDFRINLKQNHIDDFQIKI
ncbi:AraC family transcriptional regulator [Flavobacterium columnare]|uniref:AraC family transcriptional regulator n=2 Tax=Flavobacterium TaxID=237 RepID=A0A2N9PCJ0_9FLAO|nr:AraC family transcriptional regulator [Flavobacterium columnare]RVU92100.1 AraC family transcriptional regulator [Flavobacterium columnare]SPE78051.1 HTH-type transcriptional activator Btr [Flavobacterium columnare]